MILLLYVCLAAPFIVCFGIHAPRSSALGVIELLVDCAFGLDVRSHFCSPRLCPVLSQLHCPTVQQRQKLCYA